MDFILERVPEAAEAGVTPGPAPPAATLAAAAAAALLKEHGSPLFVVFESVLRDRFRLFRAAFAREGSETAIAYSYKTNPVAALCAALHQEGAFAEVTSGVEYALARSLGYRPAEIVFNGPAKRRADLETALSEGALVVVDSLSELETVSAIAAAKTTGAPFRAGLRIGLEPGDSPWARFGFDAASGAAHEALRRVAGCPGLRLEMLHSHGGSDRRDPRVYGRVAERLCDLAEAAQMLGLGIERIDIGGGFAADVPPRDYAEPVHAALDQACARLKRPIALVLEPGRAIVDPAVVLLASVTAAKTLAGGKAAVFLDAGINLLSPACRRSGPRPLRALVPPVSSAAPRPTDVFGPLCMPEDRLAENILLPPLGPGAIVAVEEAGAYALSQSTQFIDARPAVVLWGADGPERVRRRETWRDVFGLDSVPDRLRPEGAGF
jgi:diaminopimelate decarboxylase